MVKRKKITNRIGRLTRRMDVATRAGAGDENPIMKEYDAAVKRLQAKREGQKAAVLIAKARKAKIKKANLTSAAKAANASSNKWRKAAIGRKISQSRGGGYEMFYDGTKNPPTISISGGPRKSKYSRAQLAQIPQLEGQANRMAKVSKVFARKSGGTATGIKRTAEAAISRIATGKALKGMARAGGVLGIAALFNAALKGNDSKKKRG
jgi:hypothetical protein